MCLFIKLGRHVHNDERVNPIDFGGQRSRSQYTYVEIRFSLMNKIETKLLCASSSNLADMLAMVRRWTLLILGVRGQSSRS